MPICMFLGDVHTLPTIMEIRKHTSENKKQSIAMLTKHTCQSCLHKISKTITLPLSCYGGTFTKDRVMMFSCCTLSYDDGILCKRSFGQRIDILPDLGKPPFLKKRSHAKEKKNAFSHGLLLLKIKEIFRFDYHAPFCDYIFGSA